MKIIQTLICILLAGLCLKTTAYIPTTEMILSRLDRNQGTKNYKISQNILFLDRSRLDDTFQLKETWWKYANRVYLQVRSTEHPQLKLNFIYKKFYKTWMSGKAKKSKKQNYIESYFFRKNMRPAWLNSIEKVKLGRALGMVNYVFRKKEQAVWIEQDNFVVRKIAMGNTAVLTAENYQIYTGGLLFPKKRTYKSPEIEVTMEVTHLEAIKKQWNHSLKSNKWEVSHGDIEMIKHFYQNIR
ncbi:MAG: hypothetical protein OXK80_03595 [Bdellovibrionales bacterium]|nr:hypothetical protein [Bdellovibrionales bacterium]